MRLFIAVNFSEQTKSKLAALRDELRAKSVRGNFSSTENLHLTLAFLGECDAKQQTAAKAVLDSLTIKPMDICVDHIGRFRRDGGIQKAPIKSQDFMGKGATTQRASFTPEGENEQEKSVATWWAGIAENKALLALQRDLAEKLSSASFRLESRKYSPHITLAREVVTEDQPWLIEPFEETVCSVELMKPEGIQGKLTYTAVHRKSI